MSDVQNLLDIHDDKSEKKTGTPDKSLEVLKRAGVFLVISAWETFIEDTLREQFTTRLNDATSPDQLLSTFNSVAANWLFSPDGIILPKPTDLINWTGDGWKNVIREKLEEDVSSLNTPNSGNVKTLFKRYFNIKIDESWKWNKVASASACTKLDALIRLRGKIAHRYKTLVPAKENGVRRLDLINAKNLIEKLVQCTDKALGVKPSLETLPK